MKVIAAGPDALVCTVLRGGVLQSRKSIAALGLSVPMPTLTSEDLANLRIAASCGVTGVMLPFVRGKQDILALRQALAEAGAPQIHIFAKIENLAGVQALPEFLSLVDEVVIARGDLGNAMPLWELPRCQKQLSAACRPPPGALYGGHPDAGQHVHPCRAHPRRSERYLQCCVGWCVQPDAHRRDRRRAVPRAGHGVPGSDGKHRPVKAVRPSARFSVRNDKRMDSVVKSWYNEGKIFLQEGFSMGIVVIGAVFVDIKGYPLSTYIPGGRNSGRVEQVHGGVSRNIVEDIANVELRPTFVGLVDDTGMGQDVIDKLRDHKVNTQFIRRVKDGMGTWLAVFNNDGDVCASISKRPDTTPSPLC